MSRLMLPLMILIVLMTPIFSKKGSVEETEYLWMTVYTYDIPPGRWQAGEHTFQYEFEWTFPQQGLLRGEIHRVRLDEGAPLYPGYALLRPNRTDALPLGAQVTLCEPVEAIHPDQAMRFMVAWVPDNFLTAGEMNTHLNSMKATVRMDGGTPVDLIPQKTSISWDPLWNCDPWATQSLPGSGKRIGMLLPGD